MGTGCALILQGDDNVKHMNVMSVSVVLFSDAATVAVVKAGEHQR